MLNHTYNRRSSRSNHGRLRLILVIAASILGILLIVGIIPKLKDWHVLDTQEKQAAAAVSVVHVVPAEASKPEESATLPGNIGAMQYATIYARVDGYLKSRMVDIGDHVKAGQLLAEIDTPTVDQEVAQALADLQQAQAELIASKAKLKECKANARTAAAQVVKVQADQSYAATTADRWNNMALRGAISLQSRDEKNTALAAQNASLDQAKSQKQAADDVVAQAESQVNVAQAAVVAKQAAYNRYKAQQEFKYVRAPFDGVITLRKVDPGELISSGSQTQNQQLFQLAKLDVLRIYVNAPQAISRYTAPGHKAELTVSSYPERVFAGQVTNVSGALDPQTRTQQTEIRVENRDHALLPGMYAQVTITVKRPEAWVRVPSTAVVPRDNDLKVVVVKDGKAHYQKVVLGRDFGDTLEVKAGLAEKDSVIVNPPDDLRDGDPVKASSEVSLEESK